MYWRLTRREYENSKGKKNKEKLYDLINRDVPLGILAFEHDVPIGWCSVSPKSELIRLENSFRKAGFNKVVQASENRLIMRFTR